MNDNEATRLLDRLAGQVGVGRAPVERVLDAAKRSERRRRGWQVTGTGAVVLLITMGGLTLRPDAGAPITVGTRTSQTDAPATPSGTVAGPSVKVPALIGRQQAVAVQILRGAGLRPRIEEAPAACSQLHSIVTQDPAPGELLNPGGVVLLGTATRSAGMPMCPNKTTSRDRAIVAAFSRFADHQVTFGSFDTPIALGLGDTLVKTVSPAKSRTADAWVLDTTGYAEREGSVSALDLVRNNLGNLRVTSGPHPTCVGPTAEVPRSLSNGGSLVSIQPRRYSTCIDWWSVDLFVNDVGQIVGVNVSLGSP